MEAGVDIIETTDKTVYEKSGLNIALSTPVTDALQSMAQSQKRAKQVTNPRLKALYRMKAAQEAAMAAQNLAKLTETLGSLGNVSQNAAAAENPQIKIAVSVGTQKQESETKTREVTNAKTTVTGGHLEVEATSGKATFTGVDTQIHDTFRVDGFEGIEFKGVKDTYSSRTENKNHSGSVGVFVGFNGDSAGIGLEAGVSVGKGKTNVDSETWQVNNIQANTFIANSNKGKMVVDAAQIHANRWEGETQGLEVISRQDTTRYKDSQTQAGASGSVALGSGGSFSANLNHNSAKLNTSQVENQAGMFIGTGGMNATVHGNTHLAGAVIESQADSSLNTKR